MALKSDQCWKIQKIFKGKSSITLKSHFSESPSYPDTSRYNYSCLWGMMLESNRDVMVTSLDMNLAPKAANGSCIEDVLKIVSFYCVD